MLAELAEAAGVIPGAEEGQTEEVDVEEFEFDTICPKCKFEFNNERA
jgi:hypothetical protein